MLRLTLDVPPVHQLSAVIQAIRRKRRSSAHGRAIAERFCRQYELEDTGSTEGS